MALIVEDNEGDFDENVHVGVVVGESVFAVSEDEVVDVFGVEVDFGVAHCGYTAVAECMVVGGFGFSIAFLFEFLLPFGVFDEGELDLLEGVDGGALDGGGEVDGGEAGGERHFGEVEPAEAAAEGGQRDCLADYFAGAGVGGEGEKKNQQ